ncbi:CPBP family glutamic-type intramembrane protease [Tamlana flava]|uniref:CPBP family glutamic-type intramembrane protease n=1 Tax=Tamlana flava TaxID=3158572 RepID=UPI00351B86DB
MQSNGFKILEFLVAFILVPVSFVFDYPHYLKLAVGFLGFLYVLFVLLKVENEKFEISKAIDWPRFWKETCLKLILVGVVTTLLVWLTQPNALFSVLVHKPFLWFLLLFVYSIFSVYPQELIYRTFFFKRYSHFFKNEKVLVFINAIMFSLGHLFFRNVLVIVLTFLGGVLFAYTFHRTKSTFLVSIEHALYGSWLFTVGMGAMLGFPT